MRARIKNSPCANSKPGNTVIITIDTPCAGVTMRSEQDFDLRYFNMKEKSEKKRTIDDFYRFSQV